jgi:hypothetical protein
MPRLETERQYLVLVWGPDIITLPFPSFWDTFGQGFCFYQSSCGTNQRHIYRVQGVITGYIALSLNGSLIQNL